MPPEADLALLRSTSPPRSVPELPQTLARHRAIWFPMQALWYNVKCWDGLCRPYVATFSEAGAENARAFQVMTTSSLGTVFMSVPSLPLSFFTSCMWFPCGLLHPSNLQFLYRLLHQFLSTVVCWNGKLLGMLDHPVDVATVLLVSEPGSLMLVLVTTIAAPSDHSTNSSPSGRSWASKCLMWNYNQGIWILGTTRPWKICPKHKESSWVWKIYPSQMLKDVSKWWGHVRTANTEERLQVS